MTPETVDDLIRRVEAATVGDDVGEFIIMAGVHCGWVNAYWWPKIKGLVRAGAYVEATLATVEKALGDDWWGSVDFGDWRGQPLGARLTYKENAAKANGKAVSPALAILAALLRATRSTAA